MFHYRKGLRLTLRVIGILKFADVPRAHHTSAGIVSTITRYLSSEIFISGRLFVNSTEINLPNIGRRCEKRRNA